MENNEVFTLYPLGIEPKSFCPSLTKDWRESPVRLRRKAPNKLSN